MDAKIFENLAKEGRRVEIVKVLEKTCRVIWGRCRARAEALRGLGFRKHLFVEKVRKTNHHHHKPRTYGRRISNANIKTGS